MTTRKLVNEGILDATQRVLLKEARNSPEMTELILAANDINRLHFGEKCTNMTQYIKCKSNKNNSFESSLQLCPVLWVALVEEVHADPDRLPRDDVECGRLDLGVAKHHLSLGRLISTYLN